MVTWTFGLDIFTPVEGKPSYFKVTALKAEGASAEEAYEKIKDQIPNGHRVWYCFSDERLPDDET